MLNANIIAALASVAKKHGSDREAASFVEEAQGIEGIRVVDFIAGDNSRVEIVEEDGDLILSFPKDENWWKKCTEAIAYLQAGGK